MHDAIPVSHARHDLDLIAGHAAGDLTDSERDRAEALLGSCTSCADLRRDLVAIAAATSAIPASAAPRDFRLTEAQAASLRRGGWVASLLRPFAASRSRPLAMAFTSLGLAGVLVANILPALFGAAGVAGGAASAPEAAGAPPAASAGAAAEAPAPQATSSTPGAYPVSRGPQTTASNGYVFGPLSQPTAAPDQSGGSKSGQSSGVPRDVAAANGGATEEPSLDRLAAAERALRENEEANPVFVGSLVLLAIGLALVVLRFFARRVR